MIYSKDYFALQLEFARRVAKITGKKLSDVLLRYTSFYKTFRIEGWDFKKSNPVWGKYLKEIAGSKSILGITYAFYLRRLKVRESRGHVFFGCFSYEYEKAGNYIQVHFRNADAPKPGALSAGRIDRRRKELRRMFVDIKRKYPQARFVCGFSWLYSVPAYTRLFPAEYVRSAKPVKSWFRSTALWGQFLDSEGKTKHKLVSRFQKQFRGATTLGKLKTSFPYPLLETQADINLFYALYGIK